MALVVSSATFSPPSSLRESVSLPSPDHLTNQWLNSDYIAHLDGFTEIPGGWLNGHYIQLAYQLADCVTGFSYSFFGTCIILFLMNLVPGLSLRVSADEEELGLDEAQIGEFAYDYVELRREFSDVIFGEEGEGQVGSDGAASIKGAGKAEGEKSVPLESV